MHSQQERCSTTSDRDPVKLLDLVFSKLDASKCDSIPLHALYIVARDLRLNPVIIDEAIRFAISRNLLRPVIEVRCPRCGADIARVASLDEVPDRIVCDVCGRIWVKDRDLDHSLVLIIEPTEEGRRFFRSWRKTNIFDRFLARFKKKRIDV